jgi:hypothetical protein
MESITCGNNSGIRLNHYLVIIDTESGAICVYVKVTLTEGIVLSNCRVLTISSINFVESLLDLFYNLFKHTSGTRVYNSANRKARHRKRS